LSWRPRYGYPDTLYPVLILHAILLPLNGLRLHQMLQLIRGDRLFQHMARLETELARCRPPAGK
jgi:hypothetical protein